MRRAFILLPVLLLAVPLACSKSKTSSPPPDLSPELNKLTTGVCDAMFRCCTPSEAVWLLGPYINKDTCVDRLDSQTLLSSSTEVAFHDYVNADVTLPNLGALNEAAAGKRLHIDDKAVAACLDYLSTVACNKYEEPKTGCVPPDPPPGKTPCDPRLLFVGQVGQGGQCSSPLGSLECAPGLRCRTNTALGVFGECVFASDVGEPCIADDDCAEDLYCSALDGTCQEYRTEGQTCLFANRHDLTPDPGTALVKCRPDLSCDPLTDTCVAACQRGAKCGSDDNCDDTQKLVCIGGRCDQPRGEGLPCQGDSDCQPELRCEQDPADPTRDVCTQREPNGQACVTHDDCASGFCDPATYLCSAPLKAGSLCPSHMDEQCDEGRCVQGQTYCSQDSDCPGSGKCDLTTSECAWYCVGLLPDGAACTQSSDCLSGTCVAQFCRTLPLTDGEECDDSSECDSGFCSLDPTPVCKELPLPLGDPCSSDAQCDSGVCFTSGTSFQNICTAGLDEGEECGKSGQPPCDPHKFYCDTTQAPAVCVPLKETGEECDSSSQCRGSCVLKYSHLLCDDTPPSKGAVCDGPTP